MSDAAFSPGDLLSSLAANPDLLKNAMQMASALASSGVLNGLFGKEETAPKTDPAPSGGFGGGSGGFSDHSPVNGMPSGDFANLLSGLLGQKSESSSFHADEKKPSPAADGEGRTADSSGQHKKAHIPCHNDRVRLLESIRPFLPEEKRDKIDFLVKLLGLLYAAEQVGLGKLF